jgi:phage-related protein (TIGR01555 family)
MLFDGLENYVANIGTERDKASAWLWTAVDRPADQLEAMYRGGWMGRKIVDIPTDDMVREWRTWQADTDFVDRVEATERRFRIREKVTRAKRLSRIFGSSAIIVVARPRLGRPDEPLDWSKVSEGDVVNLVVEIHPYLSVHEWNSDLSSDRFGEPELYRYSPLRRGGIVTAPGSFGLSIGSVMVHASRVIPFAGVELPPYAALRSSGWGDSVFTAIADTVTSAGSATATIASLLTEAKLDVIKIPDLMNFLGTDEGEALVRKRFTLAAMLKSINNMVLLGGDEEYEQKTLTFSGLSDIHIRLIQEVAGAADIPITRFLGQSPAGLTSTGESDLRNYYDHIRARQAVEIRPVLDALDSILLASDGVDLDQGATWDFAPLWQETRDQAATTLGKIATAAKTINDTGLIDDDALSAALTSALIDGGYFPSLAANVEGEGEAVAEEGDESAESDGDGEGEGE